MRKSELEKYKKKIRDDKAHDSKIEQIREMIMGLDEKLTLGKLKSFLSALKELLEIG